MKTVNTIRIDADPGRVFELAADVLNWPKLLPHYRWVRLLKDDEAGRVVEMAASRSAIPVKWTSVQTIDAANLKIHYLHTGGPTRGMWVEWVVCERPGGGCDATIVHEMSLLVPMIRSWPGKLIVGRFFVTHIADKTLAYIKRAAEGRVEVGQCAGER